MNEVNATKCERQDDLVSYLYNELNEVEARNFQLHVNSCSNCSAELQSFQEVRQSVVAWRNESLAGVAFTSNLARAQVAEMEARRPSALARSC